MLRCLNCFPERAELQNAPAGGDPEAIIDATLEKKRSLAGTSAVKVGQPDTSSVKAGQPDPLLSSQTEGFGDGALPKPDPLLSSQIPEPGVGTPPKPESRITSPGEHEAQETANTAEEQGEAPEPEAVLREAPEPEAVLHEAAATLLPGWTEYEDNVGNIFFHNSDNGVIARQRPLDPEALVEAAAHRGAAKRATKRGRRCAVARTPAGEGVGLALVLLGDGVRVSALKPTGAVAAWNDTQRPRRQLLAGATIVEVNGVSGDASAMRDELKRGDMWDMRFRPAPMQADTRGGDSEDDKAKTIAGIWHYSSSRGDSSYTITACGGGLELFQEGVGADRGALRNVAVNEYEFVALSSGTAQGILRLKYDPQSDKIHSEFVKQGSSEVHRRTSQRNAVTQGGDSEDDELAPFDDGMTHSVVDAMSMASSFARSGA